VTLRVKLQQRLFIGMLEFPVFDFTIISHAKSDGLLISVKIDPM
jgi:hypothetical protein